MVKQEKHSMQNQMKQEQHMMKSKEHAMAKAAMMRIKEVNEKTKKVKIHAKKAQRKARKEAKKEAKKAKKKAKKLVKEEKKKAKKEKKAAKAAIKKILKKNKATPTEALVEVQSKWNLGDMTAAIGAGRSRPTGARRMLRRIRKARFHGKIRRQIYHAIDKVKPIQLSLKGFVHHHDGRSHHMGHKYKTVKIKAKKIKKSTSTGL